MSSGRRDGFREVLASPRGIAPFSRKRFRGAVAGPRTSMLVGSDKMTTEVAT